MNKKNHLLLLDKYLDSRDLLEQYRQEYNQYYEFMKEFNELKNNTDIRMNQPTAGNIIRKIVGGKKN